MRSNADEWRPAFHHIKVLRTIPRDGVRAMRLVAQCRNAALGIDDHAAAPWQARADEVTDYLALDWHFRQGAKRQKPGRDHHIALYSLERRSIAEQTLARADAATCTKNPQIDRPHVILTQ